MLSHGAPNLSDPGVPTPNSFACALGPLTTIIAEATRMVTRCCRYSLKRTTSEQKVGDQGDQHRTEAQALRVPGEQVLDGALGCSQQQCRHLVV